MAWCRVDYGELRNRVGSSFEVKTDQATVDGFPGPSSASRFALGALTNLHRSDEVTRTRQHVGHGLLLRRSNSEVFIRNLSASPLFVQTPSVSLAESMDPTRVIRLESNTETRIFNFKDFLTQSGDPGANCGGLCVVRVSFAKGWGENYRRQEIFTMPCWLELHMLEAYRVIDPHLLRSPDANNSCTSMS